MEGPLPVVFKQCMHFFFPGKCSDSGLRSPISWTYVAIIQNKLHCVCQGIKWICLDVGMLAHFYYLPWKSTEVWYVNHVSTDLSYSCLNGMLGISCPKADIKESCSESF